MVCGGRRGEKAHATTRQAGTVPQGFALPPSVRVTPDGVAAVWASRNRHHCSSASGGPSPRGAPHAPPGRSTRRTAHQHRRPTAPTPRAPHPQARNAQSPPARNAQPPPAHPNTDKRSGPRRSDGAHCVVPVPRLFLFCGPPTAWLFPLRTTATCLDSRHCLLPPPLRAAPRQPSRNTTPMPPRG